MAKKRRRERRQARQAKSTNWVLIGGGIFVGVVALFGLLYLALREPESVSLTDFCANNPERCAVMGDSTAPVTLIEVSDFGCPHCRAFHQETAPLIKEQYVDSGQVRWVFFPYALRPQTVPAANAAMCANEQDKYFEFSEAMFNQESQEASLTRDGFLTAAAEIDLDEDAFATCLEDGTYNSIVGDNQTLARRVGVSGTPTFFVNDGIVRGNVPFQEFQNQFARYLES